MLAWNGAAARFLGMVTDAVKPLTDVQDVAMDVQRSLRSQGAGESTTGTGRGNTPVAGSPRGRSRPPRSRSTASGVH